MLTALIVDDEPLARAYLRRQCEQQEIEIVAEAENALEALQIAEDLKPDLLFLDIQMPGLPGMQAAGAFLQLERAPILIFVTGYSEHAVAAFEHDTLDYLVKPVTPERLTKTLARARERLAQSQDRAEEEEQVIRQASALPPLRRLPVRSDYVVRLLRVEEIQCAVARDKRVYLRTADGEHRTYYTLKQLEALLPADGFIRVHDSCLANLDMIEELIFLGNHAYAIRLSTGVQLPVGRTRYAELQRRLGLDTAP